MKKILIIPLLLVLPLSVSASEVTGTLSTGIETGVHGTVIVAPSAAPGAGVYSSAQSVTLSAAGSSSIRYTADSSVPSCSSGTVYAGAIDISSSQVITAIACYPNGASSPTAIFQYAINPPSAPAPTSGGGSGGGGGGGGGGSSSPTSTVQGDTNGDTLVNVLDFNTLVVHWNESGSGVSGDLNGDSVVDIFDFNILIINWTV